MTSQVLLGGFELTGTTPVGGHAKVRSLEGWFGRSLRRDRQERSAQSGAWESQGYSSSAPVVLRGRILYADAASAALERRSLVALGVAGTTQLEVVDAAGYGSRMVEVDAVDLSVVHEQLVEYAITVTAPDPHLYGREVYSVATLRGSVSGAGWVWPLTWPLTWGVPAAGAPGSAQVVNGGTASYFPRLRVTGPVTNPVAGLVETGDWVRYDGVVAAGQHLDLNWGTPRRVTLGDNAVNVRHRVSFSGNWLAVPPGGGSVTFTADDADPAAQLSVWSYEGAWL